MTQSCKLKACSSILHGGIYGKYLFFFFVFVPNGVKKVTLTLVKGFSDRETNGQIPIDKHFLRPNQKTNVVAVGYWFDFRWLRRSAGSSENRHPRDSSPLYRIHKPQIQQYLLFSTKPMSSNPPMLARVWVQSKQRT